MFTNYMFTKSKVISSFLLRRGRMLTSEVFFKDVLFSSSCNGFDIKLLNNIYKYTYISISNIVIT